MTGTLRFAEPRDAAAVQAVYAPYCEETAISFELVAPTVEQMAERMAQISDSLPWLVCELDGHVAGYVYAAPHHERAAYRWSVNVAAYVDLTYHRRGIGRALYISLFAILREQGYVNAFAGITLPNPASIGMHEALGFQPVAVYRGVGYKLGRWHDVGWWQLNLQPLVPDPREPQPIGALCATPAIAAALAEGQWLLRS